MEKRFKDWILNKGQFAKLRFKVRVGGTCKSLEESIDEIIRECPVAQGDASKFEDLIIIIGMGNDLTLARNDEDPTSLEVGMERAARAWSDQIG